MAMTISAAALREFVDDYFPGGRAPYKRNFLLKCADEMERLQGTTSQSTIMGELSSRVLRVYVDEKFPNEGDDRTFLLNYADTLDQVINLADRLGHKLDDVISVINEMKRMKY
jgi:hypothetical protein